MTSISPTPTGIRLTLRVQPRASRTELAGMYGDAIRVRLAAPPVDGAANEELIRFLAGQLGVARSRVTIVSGLSGRRKVVTVEGLGAEEAAQRLLVEKPRGTA